MSEGDIWLVCAFPKSGITYLNYMLAWAIKGQINPAMIDKVYVIDVHENDKLIRPHYARPQPIKTHWNFADAAPLYGRIAKVIYLARDPFDVMFSAWDYRQMGDADGLLDDDDAMTRRRLDYVRDWIASGGNFPPYGDWVGHVLSWRDQTRFPCHLITYADLVANPRTELAHALDFLGVEVAPDQIDHAVAKSSLGEMRKQEDDEAAKGVEGAFFRRGHDKGFAKGFRFVGPARQTGIDAVPADLRAQALERFAPAMAAVGLSSR